MEEWLEHLTPKTAPFPMVRTDDSGMSWEIVWSLDKGASTNDKSRPAGILVLQATVLVFQSWSHQQIFLLERLPFNLGNFKEPIP